MPPYDPAKAAEILGKYVILGLTINDHEDNFIEQIQYHGVVTAVDPVKGITIALKGVHEGETYNLPPRPDTFLPAKPGFYKFRSTKEEIQDPDYQSTWTVNKPPPSDWKAIDNIGG